MKRKTLIALAVAAAFAAPLAYAGYTTDDEQEPQDLIKVPTSALSLIMAFSPTTDDEQEPQDLIRGPRSVLMVEGEDKEGGEKADLIAEGEDSKEGTEKADLIA